MSAKKKIKTEAEILKERLKMEIAAELNLLDKIQKYGWGELNAVESGKIGGMLAKRMHKNGNPGR